MNMKYSNLIILIFVFSVAERVENEQNSHTGLYVTHQLSTCAQLSCNNGYCQETQQGPLCICDEGYDGIYCNQQGPDYYQRTELMFDLADPDVFAINDDLFILMGTGNGLILPIYQSTDLVHFKLNTAYNPSAVDSYFDYCYLWAPNLIRNGNGFELHFVAQRVVKGTQCPAAEQDVTSFVVKVMNNSLNFGIPELTNFGAGAPKGRIAAGCNDDGCLKTIRIDPDVTGPNANDWYFYVWFAGGNNIASFSLNSPNNVIINTGPAAFPTPPSEENINEAPEVFSRNGYYYLFFSTANFNSQYAMSYIMASTINDLTRKRFVRIHSLPVRNSAGVLVETHGSNAIVTRRGQFFNVFHQGIFDRTGHMTTRSTFKKRLVFRPDGSIQSLNVIDIRWNQLPLYQYSLDISRKDGTWIGPCIGANRIKNSLGITYVGICPDSNDQLVDKSQITAFRLYYSNNNTWINYIQAQYDGSSDRLAIYIPDGTTKQVSLHWNERVTGTKYSLDIRRSDGAWIAPCVGDIYLLNTIEYLFDGNCKSASLFVELRNITSIRVCSAMNDDWRNAICGFVPYDGKTIHVNIMI